MVGLPRVVSRLAKAQFADDNLSARVHVRVKRIDFVQFVQIALVNHRIGQRGSRLVLHALGRLVSDHPTRWRVLHQLALQPQELVLWVQPWRKLAIVDRVRHDYDHVAVVDVTASRRSLLVDRTLVVV